MWRRLRRLLCCAPDSSTIDPHVPEPKDPVDSLSSSGPNAHHPARARASSGTSDTPIILQALRPSPSPTTATTTIQERDGFEDATEQLPDLPSPPMPPPSMPLRKPGVGSSPDSPPGPNRASQPPSLMIPPHISSLLAASSADGVKGSTPQTVIDSAIEIGFTPALNGFEAHTMPFIPESDTRERSILDDIPEHGTVPPAEIHDHSAAEQRAESTPIDSPTRSNSQSSLVEWSPIAEQAISDHGEQHGQSTALPPQTCQSPAEPQSITWSTSTPPNDNLVLDGYASAPSPIANTAAERETGYCISQAAPALPTRQEHAKPTYPSPPPSPPLTSTSSASPRIGLVAGEYPTKVGPSLLCQTSEDGRTANFPHTAPENPNDDQHLPSAFASRAETLGPLPEKAPDYLALAGHPDTAVNPLVCRTLLAPLPSPPEDHICSASYFHSSTPDRGGLNSSGGSGHRAEIAASHYSHTEPPGLHDTTSLPCSSQGGPRHLHPPITGPPTPHSDNRSLSAVYAQDYTQPHGKALDEEIRSSPHVGGYATHNGIPPQIITPSLGQSAEGFGKDDPSGVPPLIHRMVPTIGSVTSPHPSQAPVPPAPVSFNTHAQNLTVGFMGSIVAGGSVTIRPRMIINSDQDPGWRLLQAHVAPNAIHTSTAVQSTGKCDPGTRLKVLTRINDWTKPTTLPNVLCMTGAAGSGKSSIALSVAEECERNHTLGGTFFFSSSDDTRNSCSRFISTIAYQLALQSQTIRDSIVDAVEQMGSLVFERSLLDQATKLIFDPLRGEQAMRASWIVVIDGVDECIETDRDRLIAFLKTMFLEGRTGFRVLVIGRPDVALRSALRPGGDLDGSAQIRLSDEKEFDATDDIRQTLWTQLSKLLGPQRVTAEDVEVLVAAASGQYIFPATVIKQVKEGRRDSPHGRLKAIRSWISNGGKTASLGLNPLSALDVLYQNILSTAVAEYTKASHKNTAGKEQDPIALALQGFALLEVSTPLSRLESECEAVYDSLLGLPEGGFTSVVCDLGALIRVREPTEIGRVIQFYHRTFQEFLQDKQRAGDAFHLSQARIHAYIVKRLCKSFVFSAEPAAAIITARRGLFTEHETSWVNCTSALHLGHFLALLLKEKDQGKLETERTLKRFAKDQGWNKLKDWVDMAKKHPQFAQAQLVGETLEEWRLFFHNSKNRRLTKLAKEILGLMATVTTSTWLMVEKHP